MPWTKPLKSWLVLSNFDHRWEESEMQMTTRLKRFTRLQTMWGLCSKTSSLNKRYLVASSCLTAQICSQCSIPSTKWLDSTTTEMTWVGSLGETDTERSFDVSKLKSHSEEICSEKAARLSEWVTTLSTKGCMKSQERVNKTFTWLRTSELWMQSLWCWM